MARHRAAGLEAEPVHLAAIASTGGLDLTGCPPSRGVEDSVAIGLEESAKSPREGEKRGEPMGTVE
jgi:hypothetical protein